MKPLSRQSVVDVSDPCNVLVEESSVICCRCCLCIVKVVFVADRKETAGVWPTLEMFSCLSAAQQAAARQRGSSRANPMQVWSLFSDILTPIQRLSCTKDRAVLVPERQSCLFYDVVVVV